MYLKTVILISSCLLSMALASGEVEDRLDGSLGLKPLHEKVFKSISERILDASLELDKGKVSEPVISDEALMDVASSKLLASIAKRVASPRVTIEGSNLPALTQVAAADCLKLAYEFHDTDAERIKLFIALLTEVIPSFQWNAVLDYQHLYYYTVYYIKLRTDNGDVIFAFSSNN